MEPIRSVIKSQYNDRHKTVAIMAYEAGMNWANNESKNFENREQAHTALKAHITKSVGSTNLCSFIIENILSTIISWVVTEILDRYFPEKETPK